MVNVVEIKHVIKAYADKVAVDDLSFSIAKERYLVLSVPTAPVKPPPLK